MLLESRSRTCRLLTVLHLTRRQGGRCSGGGGDGDDSCGGGAGDGGVGDDSDSGSDGDIIDGNECYWGWW